MSYVLLDQRKVVCKKNVLTNSYYSFLAIIETDRQTLWLIKMLYAIKGDLLVFIGSKEDCMQKIKGLNQEIRKI